MGSMCTTSSSTTVSTHRANKTRHQEDAEKFGPFLTFPTPEVLRGANRLYDAAHPGECGTTDHDTTPRYTTGIQQVAAADWSALDEHACTDLADHLTRPAASPLQRVRLLFRWVTEQNPTRLAAEHVTSTQPPPSPDSALHLLLLIASDEYDYTKLFLDLCSLSDVTAVGVKGHVKGARYEMGVHDVTDTRGSWAAVWVDGGWRITDPHWGARHAVGGGGGDYVLVDDDGEGAKPVGEEDQRNVYQYNEAYFLPPPEHLIYTHYPLGGAGLQLLARPVSLPEFAALPFVKPALFALGLKLLAGAERGLLEAVDGCVDIQLGLPADRNISFMYRLWRAQESGQGAATNLDRYVFIQWAADTLRVRATFPQTGKYKLELFAKSVGKTTTSSHGNDVTDSTMDAHYTFVVAYMVQVGEAAERCRPLPDNRRQEWGPGPDLEGGGVTPLSHTTALVEAEDGHARLTFTAIRQVELLASLHSCHLDHDQLRDHVMHYRGDDDLLVVDVRLPEHGDYALELRVRRGDEITKDFSHVCSYLVTTGLVVDATPFPELSNGQAGPTKDNRIIRLKSSSYPIPFIEVNQAEDDLEMVFVTETAVEVNAMLELQRGKEHHQDMSAYVWVEVSDTDNDVNIAEVKVTVRFAEPGTYALRLFAKPVEAQAGAEADAFVNVYNYVLLVTVPQPACRPFPRAYAGWGVGCALREPRCGVVVGEGQQGVAVRVPGVTRVAVGGGEGWTGLERDEDAVWRGNTDTGLPGTDLKLMVTTQQDTAKFTTLLGFRVLSDEEITALVALQATRYQDASDRKLQLVGRRRYRQQEFIKTEEALKLAQNRRNEDELRKALREAEEKKIVCRLQAGIDAARQMAGRLHRLRHVREEAERASEGVIEEICGMGVVGETELPSPHKVLSSTLQLLGEKKQVTKTWAGCEKLVTTLGADGLSRRLRHLNPECVDTGVVARAAALLQQHVVGDVTLSSHMTSLLDWARAIVLHHWMLPGTSTR